MAYIGNTTQNQSFVPTVDYFSGDGSTVAFTLSHPVGSVYELEVVVNNVQQNPSSAYTVNGSTITFTSAPSSGTANIYVYYTSPNTQVVQPGQGTVTSSSFAAGASEFASGTLMLFQQTAAPTGWTKQTTHDNKALRIVSGTASSGGSVAFTTAFASGLSADGTTLSESQIPSHRHFVRGNDRGDTIGVRYGPSDAGGTNMTPASDGANQGTYTGTLYGWYTGGGGSHAHTLPSFAVSYVDIIIASKA